MGVNLCQVGARLIGRGSFPEGEYVGAVNGHVWLRRFAVSLSVRAGQRTEHTGTSSATRLASGKAGGK